MWAESYERVIDDIFSIQSEIAQNVLDQLGVTLLDSPDATAEGRGTKSMEAYDSYLRGGEYLRAQELYGEKDLEIAIQFYDKAVELDPGFALAYAKLAAAHGQAYHWYFDRTEERRARVRESANKGRSGLARQSFEQARVLLEAKVGQRPGDPRIHSALSIAYAGLGLKEEAVREGRRGVELLPVEKDLHDGPYRLKDMAQIYVMVGDFGAALDTLEILFSVPSEIHQPQIALDPTWARLRDHPRFQAILEQ